MTTQPVEPAAEEQTPAHDPAEHDAQEYFADSVHQGLTSPALTKETMDAAFEELGANYRRSAESSARIYQGLTVPAPEPEPEPESVVEPPASTEGQQAPPPPAP